MKEHFARKEESYYYAFYVLIDYQHLNIHGMK